MIFHYLSKNIKKFLVVDPHYPHVDERAFNVTVDWTEFQEDVGEENPLYIPEPLGQPVDTTDFENSDHTGNVVTCWSHAGILYLWV